MFFGHLDFTRPSFVKSVRTQPPSCDVGELHIRYIYDCVGIGINIYLDDTVCPSLKNRDPYCEEGKMTHARKG